MKPPNGLLASVAGMISASSSAIFVQSPSPLVATLAQEPGAKRSGQSSGSSPVVITKSSGLNTGWLLRHLMCAEGTPALPGSRRPWRQKRKDQTDVPASRYVDTEALAVNFTVLPLATAKVPAAVSLPST